MAVVIHRCFRRKVQAESQAVVSLPVTCDWSLLKGDITGRHIFHIGDVQRNSINKFIYINRDVEYLGMTESNPSFSALVQYSSNQDQADSEQHFTPPAFPPAPVGKAQLPLFLTGS